MVKVTRSALQNAASISGLLLTTEAVVSDAPEKKAAAAAGPEMEYQGWHQGGTTWPLEQRPLVSMNANRRLYRCRAVL